jgi:hypothetical protein
MTHDEQRRPATEAPLTDPEKLRVLALWFDTYDDRPEIAKKLLDDEAHDRSEVQRDLRRIADGLERSAASPERVAPPLDVLAIVDDVLSDPPTFDGVWSKNDKRWYMEGWHKLRRDLLARLSEPSGEPR